jgi:hypothetical protein
MPSIGDGTTRVLVTRPGDGPHLADLYVVAVDGGGGPPVETLLAQKFLDDCSGAPGGCFRTDARGRLLVYTGDPSLLAASNPLSRIDPLTGDRTDLGLAKWHLLSPSGARLLVVPGAGPPLLYDGDEGPVPLDDVTNNQLFFAGEVLYYITQQHELKRLAAGGTPEVVATAVDAAGLPQLDVTAAREIWIQRGTGFDPASHAYSYLDPVTLKETSCPPASTTCVATPEGRWLVAAGDTITITDRTTGTTDLITPSGPSSVAIQARPGHDEVWLNVWLELPGPVQRSMWIKKAGAPLVEIPEASFGVTYLASSFPYARDTAAFTQDGAYWFTGTEGSDDKETFQVGSADDLTGPRFDILPAGSNYSDTWLLPDGLLATPVWTTTNDRTNVYVVDPATGNSRVLGEDGLLMAIGLTRLLVNQHHIENTGDLTVFDLATGRSTVLAPEFALTAVAQAQGADVLPPGAPIAVQFVVRFPSMYDGIWLDTVP